MARTIRMERRLMARLTSKKATLDRYRPLARFGSTQINLADASGSRGATGRGGSGA